MLEQDRGEVSYGIIQLFVDNVVETGNLWETGRYGIQEGLSVRFLFPGEADDEHDLAGFGGPDEHVAEKTAVLPDVVEFVAVVDAELLDKQADRIGWLRLEPAFLDVQDLVEELAHVEAQAHPVVLGNRIGILAVKHPALAGRAEFQLVTVKLRALGGECRTDFRHLQVADADQLVVHLLPFGFELHLVGQGLPPAAAADAEMLAERLEPVRRRLDHSGDESLHIVFLLPEHLDVHDVAGDGEIDEDDHSVHVGQSLTFGGDGFDGDVLQFQVDFFPAHFNFSYNIQIYSIFASSGNPWPQGSFFLRIS